MQCTIKAPDVELRPDEKCLISDRINLSLSRFGTMIKSCQISIRHRCEIHDPNDTLVSCSIDIELHNGTLVSCEEVGEQLEESFLASLGRVKRNIQRMIKRGKSNRMSNLQASRVSL